VLGVLPGIVGSLQTNEAIKLAAEIGDPLVGRLLLFDALSTEFNEVKIERRTDCPVCGDHPTITEYIDYGRVLRRRSGQQLSVLRVPPVLRAEAGGRT